MKLYFSPGACSLSPHIVLREAGYAFDLQKVSTKTKELEGGGDFRKVNPKGYVPALGLDDGQVLTEGAAIVQYLADGKPEAGLAPANGTFERVRLQEWLNFIASEVHKGYSPLFNPSITPEARAAVIERLSTRLAYVAERLDGKPFLMGARFTVADAYLFTVLRWSEFTHVDLSAWPVLKDYVARVAARPAVQAAMTAEGILRKS